MKREIPTLLQLLFFGDAGTLFIAIWLYHYQSTSLLSVHAIGIVNDLLLYLIFKIFVYLIIATIYKRYPRYAPIANCGLSCIIVVYSVFFYFDVAGELEILNSFDNITFDDTLLPHY